MGTLKDLALAGEHMRSLREQVEECGEDLSSLRKDMEDVKESVAAVRTLAEEMQKEYTSFIKQAGSEIRAVGQAREQLSRSVYDFDLLKKQAQSEILSRFDKRLQEALVKHTEELATKAQGFRQLEEQVEGAVQRTAALTGELEKFSEIAKSIKKGDFDLSRHAQQLSRVEKDKLELMRKIDALERLVSSLRRRSQ